MKKPAWILALSLAALGCGARTEDPTTSAVTAGSPTPVVELTDQPKVYECPECGRMFDGPGTCGRGCAKLVETEVAYICPADQKPVERAGKCPRCAMNARVDKVAVHAAGDAK